MNKSKIISIIFGLLISIGTIFAVNYFCKLRLASHGINYRQNNVNLNSDLLQYTPPDAVFSDLKADPVPSVFNYKYAALDISQKYGARLGYGIPYRSIVKIQDTGEIVYDVQFNFDEKQRRVVEYPPSIKNDTAIVFLGCSITYGEGVNDHETFASLISKKIVGANVYNLGAAGSSESEIYYNMNHGRVDFYKSLTEKNIVIINTFFDAHLVRQTCDLSCYGQSQWMLNKPKYILDSKNTIQFQGFFKDYFSINFLTDAIFKSSFFTYFNFQSADAFSDRNLKLTAEIMNKIRSEYSQNHKVIDFYNYFHEYSNNDTINRLSNKILEKGFKPIVPNRTYINQHFARKTYIPLDGHPNVLGHEIMAHSILWFLERDHPSLFKINSK